MKPLPVVLLLSSFLILTSCSQGDAKKKPDARPVPVTAAKAVTRDVPVFLQVVGRAEAFESVTLKSRIDGQVSSVEFTEGRHVRQGDVLIRLDPADVAAKLRQAEAAAARDSALTAKAHADTARYAALKDRSFVSEEKVNDLRTAESSAAANWRASQAAVDAARLQLSYTTIRAPIGGVIGARQVFPGSTLKANDTALAVVNRIRPLLVTFSVSEKYLQTLREAMKAGGVVVDVNAAGGGGKTLVGKVRFIDNAVDTASGTIVVKAELPNDDESLTPGQFLKIRLVLDTLHNAVTIPNEAVQQGADGHFVYVIKDNERVELRKVVIATSDTTTTAIGQGVEAGETVVTDGQLRLTPDAVVKVKDASGAGRDKSKGDAQGKGKRPLSGDAEQK